MILDRSIYQYQYNQAFAKGYTEAYARYWAKSDARVNQLIQDWDQRKAAAEQTGPTFTEPPHCTDPDKIPVPPPPPAPWQEAEIPAWIQWIGHGVVAIAFTTIIGLPAVFFQ